MASGAAHRANEVSLWSREGTEKPRGQIIVAVDASFAVWVCAVHRLTRSDQKMPARGALDPVLSRRGTSNTIASTF